jgi:SAM-dependent methyltransferase
MFDLKSEFEFLESVTNTYVTSDSAQDRLIKKLAIKTFEPYLHKGNNALEFGCLDGFMTGLISQYIEDLTVVEGSQTFIDIAKKRVPNNVEFIHSLFEEFVSDRKFDYIFATYVLEHLSDPVAFLELAGSLLADSGTIFLVVPNGRSFSRQLARHMNLIDDLFALTQNDINHGHKRVYDRVLLDRDIHAAGLRQVSQGGLFFKLLADFQMDKLIESKILGDDHLNGLYKMGQEYPDLSCSLFSVCMQG